MKRAGPLRWLREHLAAALGLLLLGIVLGLAVLGPIVYRVNPWAITTARLVPPGGHLPLGSDFLGRDVLAGIVVGARTSLLIGVSATAVILCVGLILGAVSGYYGGWLDTVLMRVTEFFQIMPAFLFALVLVAVFSPRLWTIVAAIGLSNWAGTARLVRAEFLRLREHDFVLAARALGAGDAQIIVRQILPNAVPVVVVNGSLTVGVAILFEAGLAFLGLADPNVMSWGYMIGASRVYLRDAWWTVTFPGLAIVATVLGLSLVGDWLNDLLNPRLQERRAV